MINLESINERLGTNFIELVKEHYKKFDTEYDGERPIDLLTDDEKLIYEKYLNELKEKGYTDLV